MISTSIFKNTRRYLSLAALASAALTAQGCVSDSGQKLIISAKDQRMVLLAENQALRVYPVSTSKFGIGDKPGSYATPIGKMRIKEKIGSGMPAGTVFKSRIPTGEILQVNAPGRDPIVSRILWLEGLEASNRNAFGRYIYIHGTPEERNIGLPVSYGCIRMRSKDVIELFDSVKKNTNVFVTSGPLPKRFAMGDTQSKKL
jgi:lipoprotein-anchoring transpeptidase ErfK/SrfK